MSLTDRSNVFLRSNISYMNLIIGFTITTFLFLIIIIQYPYIFRDPDNFTLANPLVTPTHIQPE
ncbi:Cytochrome b [Trachymyrmex septentrionalis]|uniref:Cytochrome b n=1 Tax=Trachymyrmex septentrionalis TaxID=34720 RepID=A0A151JTP7_9HYME|nr:Cytochrome b [Trachymyrmex septentrionalis]